MYDALPQLAPAPAREPAPLRIEWVPCAAGGCRFCEAFGCPARLAMHIADEALFIARLAERDAAAAPVAAAA
jgi:hypothetical protein